MEADNSRPILQEREMRLRFVYTVSWGVPTAGPPTWLVSGKIGV